MFNFDEIFLSTTLNNNACPIHLSPVDQPFPVLTHFEQNWLTANGQKDKLTTTQPLLLPQSDGQLNRVILGFDPKKLHFCLGHLAQSLPAGLYYLANLADFDLSQQQALYLGFGLGAYQFNDYQSKPQSNTVRLLIDPAHYPADQVIALTNMLTAIYQVRDLINQPANVMNPETFALSAKVIAETHNAQYQEWVGDELLTHHFPLIHAVGRASSILPRLVEIKYGQAQHPKLTLVGKGVCFDSGGLDIKAAAGMRLMKKDMGGAAHALALGQWIMAQKWPIQLTILLPLVENSINANAFRPGDIIRSRKGLQVEIDNTDAEGRLILADALTYACENQPDLLIDFATLTGAARVALGTDLPAFFSNHDRLSTMVMQHISRNSDPLWPMPLFEEYRPLMQSSFADLINSSTQPYGGAITAALFLQEFITPETAWAHIDVMAYNLKSRIGRPEGGEAMGIRTLYSALAEYYNITI